MEIMVNSNIQASSIIDPVHMCFELGAMFFSLSISNINKEVSMYHLMKKSLYKILSWTQLEQRLTESYFAECALSVAVESIS